MRFACRRCHGLTYQSCRNGKTFGGLIRLLAAQTGLAEEDTKSGVRELLRGRT
jgi:hypothetical protein